MPRNDKTFLELHEKILKKTFTNQWKEHTNQVDIKRILEHSSKNESGNVGFPDLLYVNEKEQLLIMIELKSNIQSHQKECIPQIKHYLNCFFQKFHIDKPWDNKNLQNSIANMKEWHILGIAISGDMSSELNNKIDTFYIQIDEVVDLMINDLHDEDEYLALFNNINLEEISTRISSSSLWINNLLYDVKEDKRPTLLSILLISLYETKNGKVRNYFRDEYQKYDPKTLMKHIKITIPEILGEDGEKLPTDKIDMIMREFETFSHEKSLLGSEVIKTILTELKNNVIPLFENRNNYDIIGKFYQEFLRYAGIVDVQSGIVLTPEHITELFTELIDIKKDDIIFDSCCGTGSFLIAGMNKLLSLQKNAAEKLHVKTK